MGGAERRVCGRSGHGRRPLKQCSNKRAENTRRGGWGRGVGGVGRCGWGRRSVVGRCGRGQGVDAGSCAALEP